MINEHGQYVVQGIAHKREDSTGYIVVLDAADLTDWLRADHDGLNDVEKELCHEIADQVDTWAMQVLDDELAQHEQA